MEVQELRPGLWRWTGQHPDWTPSSGGPTGWEQDVACVYYEAADAVCLIDPLVPPEDRERFFEALDADVQQAARPVELLLTSAWHKRSAGELAERYDAPVRVPEKTTDDLEGLEAETFAFGDVLPGGVVALDAQFHGEALLWIPQHGALVAGDILNGDGEGGVRVCPDSWLSEEQRGGRVKAALHPLLDLPVELVLVSHGGPAVRDGLQALARALS